MYIFAKNRHCRSIAAYVTVTLISNQNYSITMNVKDELIDRLIDLSFAEDIGDGDHTTLSTIPADAMGKNMLLIKEDGVLAGV